VKPQTVSNTISVGNLNQVEDFKIAVNGKAFRILLDGIYPNKIRAVIRELCTNAFDAHVAAGKRNTPFKVTLPNTFDPTFSVRDYGTGMTHPQVMKLYSTLFESSKEGTNSEVGMLGLGSKSPFAYVDAFTTTVWMDGEKRTYRAFMGDDGVPKIALLGSEESDEPQGVEVSITANNKDCSVFRDTATDILQWFATKPVIEGQNVSFPQTTYAIQGNGWYIRQGHGQSLARQGCVVYPINPSAIPNLSQLHQDMLGAGLIMDFNIGTLDVAPSREELSYGPTTCDNIVARLNAVADEVFDRFGKEINEAETAWQAGEVYVKLSRSGLPQCITSILSKSVWKGKVTVGDSIHLGTLLSKVRDANPPTEDDEPLLIFDLHYFDATRVWQVKRLELDHRSSSDALRRQIRLGDDRLLIFTRLADEEHKVTYEPLRLRQSSDASKATLVITATDAGTIQKVIETLGSPPFKWVHDLPKPVIERVVSSTSSRATGKTKKTEIKARQFDLTTGKISDEKVVEIDGAAYFIPTKENCIVGSDGLLRGKITEQCNIDALKAAGLLKYFKDTRPIYFVGPVYQPRLADATEWENLITVIEAALPSFEAEHKAMRQRQTRNQRVQSAPLQAFLRLPAVRFNLDRRKSGVLYRYMQALDALATVSNLPGNSDDRIRAFGNLYPLTGKRGELIREWDANPGDDNVVKTFDAASAAVKTAYPLLGLINTYGAHNHGPQVAEYIEAVDLLLASRSVAAVAAE